MRTKPTRRYTALACACGALFALRVAGLQAAETAPPTTATDQPAWTSAHKARWQNMTDEERAALRAARKARWDAMSEEERAAHRAQHKGRWANLTDEERAARRAAMKARWEAMSPEERAAHKARWHERHGPPEAPAAQ